jgi:hypothetical protein
VAQPLRHPSKSWGLKPPGHKLAAQDPSFRWDDGAER